MWARGFVGPIFFKRRHLLADVISPSGGYFCSLTAGAKWRTASQPAFGARYNRVLGFIKSVEVTAEMNACERLEFKRGGQQGPIRSLAASPERLTWEGVRRSAAGARRPEARTGGSAGRDGGTEVDLRDLARKSPGPQPP